MKISLPVMLIAALTLCGCNSGNSTETESSSAETTAVTTTAAETTSVTSTTVTTTATSKVSAVTTTAAGSEAAASDSSDEAALMDSGIILPEAGDTDTASENAEQFTFPQSEDDAPIELPIIPIG